MRRKQHPTAYPRKVFLFVWMGKWPFHFWPPFCLEPGYAVLSWSNHPLAVRRKKRGQGLKGTRDWQWADKLASVAIPPSYPEMEDKTLCLKQRSLVFTFYHRTDLLQREEEQRCQRSGFSSDSSPTCPHLMSGALEVSKGIWGSIVSGSCRSLWNICPSAEPCQNDLLLVRARIMSEVSG